MRAHLIVALVALAAFGASLLHGFHFDDAALLSDPAITSSAGFHAIATWLQTRPLTWLSFWLNYQASGAHPLAWHAVSLLLHAVNAALVYEVLKRLVGIPAALMAALFFAVHPIQAESVAYVFSRGTELCTLFCLLTWIAWTRGRPWLAVALFALALMAKEECAAFPLFLAFVDWRHEKSVNNKQCLAAMLALSLAAGLRVLAATAHAPHSGAGFSAGVAPLAYLSEQGYAVLRYLQLIRCSVGLHDRPSTPHSSLDSCGGVGRAHRRNRNRGVGHPAFASGNVLHRRTAFAIT